MLPHLYEFSWSAGHLVFLTVFGSVAATIVACVVHAAVRAARPHDRESAGGSPDARTSS